MKTQFLLFHFLCIFAFSSQAQELQRNSMPKPGSERIRNNFKQTQSGAQNSMVPFKRNLFSSSSFEFKWDTMICYHDSSPSIISQRVSRTYNFFGEPLTQLTEQLPQGSAIWVNFARETFTFDSAGNWLTYLSELWQNNSWANYLKKEFTYNSNGDQTTFMQDNWQSGRWVNDFLYSYHFNSHGLQDTCIYQVGQDTIWVNFRIWFDTYDTNDALTNEKCYTWINNVWDGYYNDTYTNDSNGYHLTCLQQIGVSNSWVNNAFIIYTNDTAGNFLSLLYQQWQNNTWINQEYDSKTYDSVGNNTLWLVQNWTNGSWVNSGQTLDVYDTSNNLFSETFQSWINSHWRNSYLLQYTYDLWGNSLTGKSLTWGLSGWAPSDGSIEVFADHQRDNYLTFQNIYMYSAIIDSVILFVEPSKSQLQVTLFPNPSHTIVYVYSALASTDPNGSITMYDLRGQIVLSKPFIKEKTGIDISDLKPGVYCVKVTTNQISRVLKFVKD